MMNLRIAPFLAWFGLGIMGQYMALQLQLRGLASTTATNLAFLTFLLGGVAALKLNSRLRQRDATAN